MKRFPWISASLVLACAVASSLPVSVALFQYDRALVGQGEGWRLLTGQMVHWTTRMAFLDLAVLLGLGGVLEATGRRRAAVTALLLGATMTGMAVLWFSSGVPVYRGASGLASALFVLAAMEALPESRRFSVRLLAVASLALFLAKVGVEVATGQSLVGSSLPFGIRVLPAVHLAGGAGGAIAFLLAGAGSKPTAGPT